MRTETIFLVVVMAVTYSLYLVPVGISLSSSTPVDSNTSDAASEFVTPNSTSFIERHEELGLQYRGRQTRPGMQATISNSGVYVSDVNNDQWMDVLAVGGDRPRLFRNTGGAFEDSGALPPIREDVRMAVFVDQDADGWEDLILFPWDASPVFLRNEGGNFTRVDAGFDEKIPVPTGATVGDFDENGCSDLVVVQNGDWIDDRPTRLREGTVSSSGDNGGENYLYMSNCSTFSRRSLNGTHWSLATSAADFTGDGRTDLHVANDFYADILYVNEGDGTFSRERLPNTNRNGMASEVGDVNRDGRLDIFVSNIYWTPEIKEILSKIGVIVEGSKGNNLLVNQGGGTFVDAADRYGVRNGHWGWAAVMTDFDNDGDKDLFHTTREQFMPEEVEAEFDSSRFDSYQQPTFFERTDVYKFTPRNPSGIGLRTMNGRGASQIDFDNDGDLDLIVADASGPFRLYENTNTTGSSVQVAVGGEGETTVLGTRVTVVSDGTTRTRTVTSRSDFLSQESRVVHFGVGRETVIQRVHIEFPSGSVVTVEDVRSDQRLVVNENGVVATVALNQSRVIARARPEVPAVAEGT